MKRPHYNITIQTSVQHIHEGCQCYVSDSGLNSPVNSHFPETTVQRWTIDFTGARHGASVRLLINVSVTKGNTTK